MFKSSLKQLIMELCNRSASSVHSPCLLTKQAELVVVTKTSKRKIDSLSHASFRSVFSIMVMTVFSVMKNSFPWTFSFPAVVAFFTMVIHISIGIIISGVWIPSSWMEADSSVVRISISGMMIKSVTRQENKYLENTLLDRPCPARRHMCFLWLHSYVKIQWLFAKQKFQICSPTMSQKLQHNNSNVDRAPPPPLSAWVTTPDK